MNILINTSNLKVGGGVQVADSIVRCLHKYRQHRFVVVLSSALAYLEPMIKHSSNCILCRYDLPMTLNGVIFGKNRYLDKVVEKFGIECVYTVFGPSLWRPNVRHVCGFARPQIIYTDSPYFAKLSILKHFLVKVSELIKLYNFKISSDAFVTENEDVSEVLRKLVTPKKVFTVTNNCSQLYETPELWEDSPSLPDFDGCTILTIAANYPHKNLVSLLSLAKHLKERGPSFKFRFVLTVSETDLANITPDIRPFFHFLGKVKITQCPRLYQKADIMLLPSLLECFSASYAEAMRMGVPIVTCDLPFAHGLCADAAAYYSPLNVSEMADAVVNVFVDKVKREKLIDQGKRRYLIFDTPEQRTKKIIELLERNK